MNINSIFKQPVPVQSNTVSPKQSKTINVETKSRKTRADKLHDVKFPVNLAQRQTLRIIAQKLNIRETDSNSQLLQRKLELIHQIPLHDYKDTKRYMHVKLNLESYNKLKEMAIKQDMSIRKALTLIMLSILKERGSR